MARSVVTQPASTNRENPSWMSMPWRVLSTDAGLGLVSADTLLFWVPGTVKILKGGQTQDWGKSCQVTSEGLSGFTVDGRPFLIQYQSGNGKGRLTCQVHPLAASTIRTDPGGTWIAEDGNSGDGQDHGHHGDLGHSQG